MATLKLTISNAKNCTTGYVDSSNAFKCDLCDDGFWFNPIAPVQCKQYFLNPVPSTTSPYTVEVILDADVGPLKRG